jgi:hypothetical protein
VSLNNSKSFQIYFSIWNGRLLDLLNCTGPDRLTYLLLLFADEYISRNCQQDINVVEEGYVETPGYPQYNVETNCSWKLRAQDGQRVQLSLLDISLRGTHRKLNRTSSHYHLRENGAEANVWNYGTVSNRNRGTRIVTCFIICSPDIVKEIKYRRLRWADI